MNVTIITLNNDNMQNRNELIRCVRNIIGDERPDGFYTSVLWNHKNIDVPNFLFKDGTTQYPEIRISPFLHDTTILNPVRQRSYNYENKIKILNALFQVDIYATNLVLVNNIFEQVRHRIGNFYDIDTVLYGYDKNFQLIDEEKNIYYCAKYNINSFRIIGVQFGNIAIHRVSNKKLLQYKDTYYVDKTGLYVCTDFPIKRIKINVVLNGLLFPDGTTAYQKGIIKTKIKNIRSLSELENNNVERISFELDIVYRLDSLRNPGPIATGITIDNNSD